MNESTSIVIGDCVVKFDSVVMFDVVVVGEVLSEVMVTLLSVVVDSLILPAGVVVALLTINGTDGSVDTFNSTVTFDAITTFDSMVTFMKSFLAVVSVLVKSIMLVSVE